MTYFHLSARIALFCLFSPVFCAPLWAESTCNTPALLAVLARTDTSATLSWTDVADAYQIEVRLVGQSFTGAPTHNVPGDPPFVLTGLTPGQTYRFQVRGDCSAAGMGQSGWSTPFTFSTELNNDYPCPLDLTVRDTTCASGGQLFRISTQNAPGTALGVDTRLSGVRLAIEHPWRSDLRVWLNAPDGTRIQLVAGLNAGDQNLGAGGAGACWQFIELTDDTLAQPLSAAAEQDNITGRWRSVGSFAAFHNGQNPNGHWTLEICDSKAAHTGRLRLAQLVFESIGCQAPAFDTVTNIAIDGATLHWLALTPPLDSLEIEYGPRGFLPGTGAGIVASPTPGDTAFTLSGLAPLTAWHAYIRRRCAANFWSGYSQPVEFFTVCPATLTENFEGYALCPTACADPCPLPGVWQNAPDDDYEWKVRTGPGGAYPVAGPPAASEGAQYLFYRNGCTPSGANGKKTILRTRCIEVSAPAGDCHFAFDLYMNTKLGNMSGLALQVSTDGGVNWSNLQTWSGNRGKRWRREFVSLAPYDGQTCLFQFVVTGAIGVYGDLALDHISFHGSTAGGTPDYTFYRDQDGDGFGADALRYVACSPDTPSGYSPLAGDCNDAAAAIHPNAPEILCNGVDENCNGMTDDTFIAAPTAAGDTVCQGETAICTAISIPKGQFFWWNAPQGGVLLGSGASVALANLSADQTVWVADSLASGGCASMRTAVAVRVHQRPDLQIQPDTVEICAGQSFDLAELGVSDANNLSGGVQFHSAPPDGNAYLLSQTLLSPLANTTYFAQKITLEGCENVLPIPVVVHALPTVIAGTSDSVALCRGTVNATLLASASGATPVQFAWNTGSFLPQTAVNTQTPGSFSYTVTVTDAHGCSAADATIVFIRNSVTSTSISAVQNASICNGTDGWIALDPVNGQAPYQFVWSGPQSGVLSGVGAAGDTLEGLSQGGYRVTITDATACSMVLPTLVVNAPGFTVNTPAITPGACPGQSGTITVTAQGIDPQWNWSSGATTPGIVALYPVSYSVTVSDGNCQQVLTGLFAAPPPPFQVALNQRGDETCAERNDGFLDLTIGGATPPYQFLWNDSATTEDRTGLAAGDYSVTINDANGCATTANYTIEQPPPFALTPTVQPVRCNGENNGSIALSFGGGTAPYQAQWSNGSNSFQQNNLPPGQYAITATDNRGCSLEQTLTVGQPAPLSIAPPLVTQPACVGKADGAALLAPAGGNAPYAYLWSDGQTTQQAQNLDTGVYFATVTDQKGCTAQSDSAWLNAQQTLTLTLDSIRHINCFNNTNGYIDVDVSGATGALAVFWNETPGALPLVNVAAGTYRLRVADANGCAIQDTFALTQPAAAFSVTIDEIIHAPCAGEPGASIRINAAGGTEPYRFNWSNGAQTADLDGVPFGVYALNANDANGCIAGISNVELTEPEPIEFTPYITHIPCFGATFGYIESGIGGGAPPYSFQWSLGDTTQQIYNLPAGFYALTIYDAAGCVKIIDSLEVIASAADFEVVLRQNQPVSCNAQSNGALQVEALNGTGPYQFAWSAPIGLHANVPSASDWATGLSGGQYSVTVTDATGCFRAFGPMTVDESPSVLIAQDSLAQIVCKGDSTGFFRPDVSGGVPPYAYAWSNGAVTADLQGAPAGFYTLTVTDWRGCTGHTLIELVEPELALNIVLELKRDDVCGDHEGAVFTHPEGGAAPYTFLWSNGGATSDIAHLSPGLYQMTLTDQNQCAVQSPWYAIDFVADSLTLASYTVDPVVCRGEASGALNVGVSGGTSPLHYFWSNGAQTPLNPNLAVGTYRLTVTDANGCTEVFNLPPITQPAQALTVNSTLDSLPDGWQITLQAAGGWGGYSALWDDGSSGLIRAQLPSPGWYAFTLTDAEGCTETGLIQIGVSAAGEPAAAAHCRIVPNPAADRIRVETDRSDAYAQYEIWNAAGMRLLVSEKPEIDVSALPSGVYTVLARRAGATGVGRFVKK